MRQAVRRQALRLLRREDRQRPSEVGLLRGRGAQLAPEPGRPAHWRGWPTNPARGISCLLDPVAGTRRYSCRAAPDILHADDLRPHAPGGERYGPTHLGAAPSGVPTAAYAAVSAHGRDGGPRRHLSDLVDRSIDRGSRMAMRGGSTLARSCDCIHSRSSSRTRRLTDPEGTEPDADSPRHLRSRRAMASGPRRSRSSAC